MFVAWKSGIELGGNTPDKGGGVIEKARINSLDQFHDGTAGVLIFNYHRS